MFPDPFSRSPWPFDRYTAQLVRGNTCRPVVLARTLETFSCVTHQRGKLHPLPNAPPRLAEGTSPSEYLANQSYRSAAAGSKSWHWPRSSWAGQREKLQSTGPPSNDRSELSSLPRGKTPIQNWAALRSCRPAEVMGRVC